MNRSREPEKGSLFCRTRRCGKQKIAGSPAFRAFCGAKSRHPESIHLTRRKWKEEVPTKSKILQRRKSGVSSILRAKSRRRSQFTSDPRKWKEEVPAKSKDFASPEVRRFGDFAGKISPQVNSLDPRKWKGGFPQNRRFCIAGSPAFRHFAEQNLATRSIPPARGSGRGGSRKIRRRHRQKSGVPRVLRANLAARSIHLTRGSERRRVPAKSKILHRRKSGVPRILRSKISPQGQFT